MISSLEDTSGLAYTRERASNFKVCHPRCVCH